MIHGWRFCTVPGWGWVMQSFLQTTSCTSTDLCLCSFLSPHSGWECWWWIYILEFIDRFIRLIPFTIRYDLSHGRWIWSRRCHLLVLPPRWYTVSFLQAWWFVRSSGILPLRWSFHSFVYIHYDKFHSLCSFTGDSPIYVVRIIPHSISISFRSIVVRHSVPFDKFIH